MKVIASIITFALSAVGLSVSALGADPMGSVSKVERGVWCNDFPAAQAYAEAKNLPLLVLWANPGCAHCAELEKACQSSAFTAWQKERQLVMVFGYGTTPAANKACKEFAKNSSGKFPYIAVAWSANTSGEAVLERFSGLPGKMGFGSSTSQPLEEQFMTAVDTILSDYDPRPAPLVVEGGSFMVPDTDGSRLEAVAGQTRSVDVPLVRENASCVATNVLIAGEESWQLVWAKGECEKVVSVDTSALGAGEDMPLSLSMEGAETKTSAIHGVEEPENAPANAKFLGESFDFGEWTFDYSSARELVKANPGSRLLVMFSGPLWCPYCIGMEQTLLTTPEFKAWAKENRVALVLMEQGRASSPATALGQRGPRLTTYVPDPNKVASGVYVSGAAYRSRKGVTEEDANFLIERAAAYTARWLQPGSTAARLGNPTVLLVDPQTEEIHARLSSYRIDVEGVRTYPVEENLARLDALLELAEASEADKYPQTTTRELAAGGVSEFSLQVNAASVSYRLQTRAGLLDLSVACDDGSACTMTVTAGERVVASGTNAVSFVATPADITDGMAVRIVRAFAPGEKALTGTLVSSWTQVDSENEFVQAVFKTELVLAEGGQALGTLALSNSKRGKVSARCFDARTGKTVSASGYWSEPDEIGTVRMFAEKYKGLFRLELSLTASGVITATAVDARSEETAKALCGTGSALPCDYAAYLGKYTVSLPVVQKDDTMSFGAGYVRIDASTSLAKRTGRVSCSVLYPDGKLVSVAGQLWSGEDGFANLTITAKSGKELFLIPLSIRPMASLAPTHRAVVGVDACRATWVGADKKSPFRVACKAYGSIFDRTESLVVCCGTTRLSLGFESAEVVLLSREEPIVSVVGDGADVIVSDRRLALKERQQGLSLTYARTTGLVSGKTRLLLADGRYVAAKLKGVVCHDWSDCGCFDEDPTIPLTENLPVVSGTCTFVDKVNGKSVTRGFPFSLKTVD